MSDYFPFVIVGLVTGAIYGLAGLGLVLTYKTSGIFNFAHGAIAAFGAFVFYWLTVDQGLHWSLALAITVIGAGAITGVVMERLARHLTGMSTVLKIVATVGIVLIVQGLTTLKYKPGRAIVPNFLPTRAAFHPFDVTVSWSDVIIMATGVVIAAGLYVFFRTSRMGVAMRAVVDDPDLLDILGTDPVAVRRWSWIVGTMLAMLSGIFISQGSNLDSIALTFLVVQAFGAAAIGLFSSLPITYVGGSIVGILTALAQKQFANNEHFNSLGSAVPVILLFVVLLLIPRARLVTPGSARFRSPRPWKAPPRVRFVAGGVMVAILVLLPNVVGTKLVSYSSALAYVMLFLSLGLLVKTSGQVSLCHMALAAVGAAAFSQLRVDQNVPWLPAVLLAGLFAIPVGAIIAIPAIRLSGLYLALATLGFGITMERFFYPLGIMFSKQLTGRAMPRPSFGASDRGYYYIILAFTVVTAVVMVAIHEGRIGRLLRGMADSPTALSTLGLSVNTTRVTVFCTSAYIAAVAGALNGVLFSNASGIQFSPFRSLVLVALLALNPFAEPWYGLSCAVGLVVVPVYFNDSSGNITNILNLLFGVFAVLVAVQGGTQPAPIRLQRLFERFAQPARAPAVSVVLPEHTAPARAEPAARRPGIEVRELTVSFGGVVAVNALSMQAEVGRITGLIGPNGAGKTTTFNACTGLIRPTSGRVSLHGQDVTHTDTATRARRGLGRTFQRMELFDSLTVAENVALGYEAAVAGARPHAQLAATRAQRAEMHRATQDAIALCGLGSLAGARVGELPTGRRRLVELARVLAGRFDVLLLDEPSSGVDVEETRRFGEILQRIVTERDVAVLLVEHDMSLVMEICHYIYVLDFGELISEGPPTEIAASAAVRAAYLG